MSTGLNCFFIEVEPGAWYYLLEEGNAPKNAWDWREFSTAYGPFGDVKQAQTHLMDEHANPGGWTVDPYEPGRQPDEVLAAKIAEAINPNRPGFGLPYH